MRSRERSFVAGAAVQWLRDGLADHRSAAEIEAMARSVTDTRAWCSCPR